MQPLARLFPGAGQTAFNTQGNVAVQAGQQIIHGNVNINQQVSRSLYFLALILGVTGTTTMTRSFLSCCLPLPKQPSTLTTSRTILSASPTPESTSSGR